MRENTVISITNSKGGVGKTTIECTYSQNGEEKSVPSIPSARFPHRCPAA